MPASSWKDLKAYHSHFSRATRAILQAAGLTDVFLERNDSRLKPSNLQVTFERGEAVNLETLADGTQLWDAFEGATLTIALRTWRPDMPTPPQGLLDQHAEFEAMVEAALTYPACPYDASNLPYYAVQRLKPLRPTRDFEVETMQDVTSLPYQIDWAIRSDAYAGLPNPTL